MNNNDYNANHQQDIDVDIWSDIICPFCYIGKRNFEQALEQTGLSDHAKIVWRSFELAPEAQTDPGSTIYDVLGKRKGWSTEQSKQIHRQMEEKARLSGLEYHFDQTIPANSRNAHRLLHLAKKHGVQDDVKERLLKGYFTDGRNIDDADFLIETARHAGLKEANTLDALKSDEIDQDLREDIEIARKLGIGGVPFFILNQKYAISGAQPVEVFVQALEKVNSELHPELSSNEDAASCDPDERC